MNRGAAFYRNVARLALPILLQNLCTTLLGLIDTFMVGALGEAPLAAVLVFGTRMFQNFAEIRRELLTSKQKRAKISQDIVRDGEDGTK